MKMELKAKDISDILGNHFMSLHPGHRSASVEVLWNPNINRLEAVVELHKNDDGTD